MADVVERVKALIARTSSTHEEEARTAALIACRLIREHHLEVTTRGEVPSIGHEDFWSRAERARSESRARAADPRRAAEERARQAAFDEWEERQRRDR
jgi:hypothetical protein